MGDTRYIDPPETVSQPAPVPCPPGEVALSLLGQLVVGLAGGVLGAGLVLFFMRLWGVAW